ncbi:MAG: copper oxidase [Candidatus Synechococcus spongiarum SP3]|uniref:Purine nucleoside phosphorylase n=1 Tax=Candidatus Synechococcus spongiarum SP3 TaxID=1604020 RepID=A0A0G2IWV5_9SYNE|nr:MAG: copper oxidase [Candidatus Synechococcus spongiarum SP3]
MADPSSAPFTDWPDSTFNTLSGWTWVGCYGGYMLQCDALQGFAHGFFTRHWSERGPAELAGYLSPGLTVHRLRQVHGGAVVTARDAVAPPWPKADGLVSTAGGQSLWVCGADCTPVLMADPETGHVAACHGGWRSLAAGVLSAAVEQLMVQGVKPAALQVALGPAISGPCYQVERSVSSKVAAPLHEDGLQRLLAAGDLQPNAPINGQPLRDHLDIRGAAALQLQDLGIPATAIHTCPYCTFSKARLFHSWRRDQRKVVQWSGIVGQAMAGGAG